MEAKYPNIYKLTSACKNHNISLDFNKRYFFRWCCLRKCSEIKILFRCDMTVVCEEKRVDHTGVDDNEDITHQFRFGVKLAPEFLTAPLLFLMLLPQVLVDRFLPL